MIRYDSEKQSCTLDWMLFVRKLIVHVVLVLLIVWGLLFVIWGLRWLILQLTM